MKNKVILAGGSGYLGSVLADYYKTKAKEVIILTRGKSRREANIVFINWDGKTRGAWCEYLENADLLINLTGKNVNCRYSEKNKSEILNSRLDATNVLGEALSKCNNPPNLWIQCASATIYRYAEDRAMDEYSGEIGTGFSEMVCMQWEQAFERLQLPHIRKVVLRIGIVLGHSGGAYPRLRNLVKYGLGGKQGNGQQMVSWIHEDDVVSVIDWIDKNKEAEGVFNCTSPTPISNADFMAELRKSYNRRIGLPAPAWLLEAGAAIIGTETELILKSRWVLPARLLDMGYEFKYKRVVEAFGDLVEVK
ncbi:MAG TPA: TIGR01777 family oxidoreductase [Cytophagaceae bacterium]